MEIINTRDCIRMNLLHRMFLGYVNKEGKACMGIELMADYYLSWSGWMARK